MDWRRAERTSRTHGQAGGRARTRFTHLSIKILRICWDIYKCGWAQKHYAAKMHTTLNLSPRTHFVYFRVFVRCCCCCWCCCLLLFQIHLLSDITIPCIRKRKRALQFIICRRAREMRLEWGRNIHWFQITITESNGLINYMERNAILSSFPLTRGHFFFYSALSFAVPSPFDDNFLLLYVAHANNNMRLCPVPATYSKPLSILDSAISSKSWQQNGMHSPEHATNALVVRAI